MTLRINTNTAATNGHRNLLKNDAAVGKSLERLSSGLRINRAADDAAGLIISEQMRAQITGLNQAIANSEQAVTMIQTAEGALDEVSTLLNKARSLAIHAANEGLNDSNQLIADQTELDNIIDSVNRIAESTQFGTKKILDGTLSNGTTNSSAVSAVKLGGDYTSLLSATTASRGYHTL
ncbi:MAG: Phase flagellin, partial [Planctomycetota bacterium]